MNPIVRWFHQLGSPPTFDRFAARWSRVFYLAAVPVLLVGMWQALLVVPPEAKQLDSFRILYIHVPSAWMSLFVFALMALYAAIALIWRIKVCEIHGHGLRADGRRLHPHHPADRQHLGQGHLGHLVGLGPAHDQRTGTAVPVPGRDRPVPRHRRPPQRRAPLACWRL